MNYQEVRYYITSQTIPRTLLKFEPINWDEDDKRLIRNTESWGVFTKLSNDLEFVKDGKELIESIYNNEGTETTVVLERYIYEDLEIGWELDYKGNLDMKTYRKENERVTVQFLTGGLQSLIESQFDEPYELERNTDINGNEISDLNFDRIYWEGRRIFLESQSSTKEKDKFTVLTDMSRDVIVSRNIIMEEDFSSENLEISSTFNIKGFNLTPWNGNYERYDSLIQNGVDRLETPALFYTRQEEEPFSPFVFNIDLSLNYYYDRIYWVGSPDLFDLVLQLSFYKFEDGLWYFDRSINLDSVTISSPNSKWVTSESVTVGTILENQGIALTPYLRPKENTGAFYGILDLYNVEALIKLEQNSDFAPSEFNGIRLYDAVERMLEIYTGERNRIKSDYLDLGKFKNVLLSSGRYIRELEDARLSVELKDLYETNNYFNLGWSVETIDGKEKFVLENKSYFFVDYPLFNLGEVSKLSISCASEFLYKSLSFGNKKAGDYEEIQGLQEYNAFTTYQTHLKTADNKYEVAAKIRADLVGAELARRKNITTAPNEDTRYDNQNFLFDCKPFETDKFTPKVWQDQLDSQPICYDPPTAGNLLLTPFRSLQRHANIFKSGLTKYNDKFTRYSSGTGDVNVATQLEDKPLRYENSNIINSELDNAIYEAEYYEFEKPLDLEIRRKLKGYTTYNQKNVPNFNFLVKFTYRNQEYSGWIVEVGFDNPGTWKLIKKNS